METICCNKCHQNQPIVKAGRIRNKQRYKCNSCMSYFIPKARQTKRRSKAILLQAVELYLEGMNIRAIGRYLKVSHTSVIRWLRKMADVLKPILPSRADHIEIDELYLYLKNKQRKRWLWLAICRESKRILGFVVGGRGKATIEKLYHRIVPISCETYYTDNHGPYKLVLPEQKHSNRSGQTNTIEGINSAIRHYLSRFRRRSKCYSKSLSMVEASIKLLMYKYDNRYLNSIAA